ncbi:Predicted arabinose efflux permease, MFS family [Acinetobacter marinus]|uniref:Predicted arabinose efflux permease, MFS family n=1 Tax=Acinetobacter marinus TaxID=281375 RepID=A0A1G6GVR4_9GAMM|nr:MFS transporter [Acinetobacter marinus]SDB86044.1 Predicted arabinose efflux permease, MFS family [Acinetobacter marinus]
MSGSTPFLLGTRRFAPMFATQFFGAFNDNIFKYALLMVFTYGWIPKGDISVSTLNNVAALLFILPFFIFSATAGQIADRYERSNLIQWLKIGEIVVMCIATVGFMVGNIWLLLFALFMMGAQSAIFGPIKYAILPDILEETELMTGNAIFQSGTSLAILLGMVIGGIVISLSAGNMWWICLTLIGVAILGFVSSRMILKQKIADPNLKVNWNVFATSWQIVKFSYGLPLIFLVLLGNSWYWFYGATVITQIPQMTAQYLHGNENVSSLILTFFSIGVVIGSALCKKLSGEHVNIKMVPYGAVGLTLFALYLAWALAQLPTFQGELFNITQVFAQGIGFYHVFAAVTLLGISGGFYIVPLYAMMQAKAPISHRARVVAANNIFNAIFMVLAAIFSIIVLSSLNLSLAHLFVITAILSAMITIVLLIALRRRLSSGES